MPLGGCNGSVIRIAFACTSAWTIFRCLSLRKERVVLFIAWITRTACEPDSCAKTYRHCNQQCSRTSSSTGRSTWNSFRSYTIAVLWRQGVSSIYLSLDTPGVCVLHRDQLLGSSTRSRPGITMQSENLLECLFSTSSPRPQLPQYPPLTRPPIGQLRRETAVAWTTRQVEKRATSPGNAGSPRSHVVMPSVGMHCHAVRSLAMIRSRK